jgi:TonB family protein
MRHLLLALLLVPCVAGAKEPEPITAKVRAAWAKDLRASKDLDVKHVEYRRRPAPFITKLPCEYQDEVQHVNGTLDGAGLHPILEILASTTEQSPIDPLTACADTSHDELVFESGKLVLRYLPGTQRLTVTDEKHRVDTHELAAASDSLLALLRTSIASDSRLAAITECARSQPTSPDAPALGTFVFVDELPDVIDRVKPRYPAMSRARGEEGTVLLHALVTREGRVARTVVVRSVSAFDEEAVRAVEQWRFEPAKLGGTPLAVWVAIPVRFSLN